MGTMTKMTRGGIAIASLGLMLASQPLLAETEEISVPQTATWIHSSSNIEFPPVIDNYVRDRIVDYGSDNRDVSANYTNDANGTILTVYVYDAGVKNIAILDEVSAEVLTENPNYKARKIEQVSRSLITPENGSGENSGVWRSFKIVSDDFKSTGLELFHHNDWIVKIRVSSADLAPEQLADETTGFLKALTLPQSTTKFGKVDSITDCSTMIDFKKAKRGKAEMSDLIMLGALANSSDLAGDDAEDAEEELVEPEQATICRDSKSASDRTLYRFDDSSDAYLMMLNDNGIGINVSPKGILELLKEDGSDSAYWPELLVIGSTEYYKPYRSLPSPAQIFKDLGNERPVVVVEQTEEGSNIIIGDIGDIEP